MRVWRSAHSGRRRSSPAALRRPLKGKPPSDEVFAAAGEIAKEDCSPVPDGRGPVDYKRHLASVLSVRALRHATARALQQEALATWK